MAKTYKDPDNLLSMPASVAGRLGYAIKLAQHGVRMRMDEALRPLGLTTPQYGVLCALEAEPGMSNADLARGLFVTAQTMHGILTTLERDGLVRRGSDQTHGKRLTSELTRQGAGLLRRAHGEIGQVEKLLAAGLSDSEVERLVRELLGCAVRMGSR